MEYSEREKNIVLQAQTVSIGRFLIACAKLDDGVRGGKQKLQRIVGESIFYSSPNKKKWFYNVEKLISMPDKELIELTEKVNQSVIKKRYER